MQEKIKKLLIVLLKNFIPLSIFIGSAVIFQWLLKLILRMDEANSAIFGFFLGFAIMILNYVYIEKGSEK